MPQMILRETRTCSRDTIVIVMLSQPVPPIAVTGARHLVRTDSHIWTNIYSEESDMFPDYESISATALLPI